MLNKANDTAKQHEHYQTDQHSKNSEHDMKNCQDLDVTLHGIHIARVVYLDLPSRSISILQRRRMRTQCCIAGGGPAGMMLGFLLARVGVDVLVLEKHSDFLRDFRGDTIHPSTLELMYELGILDDLLRRPHQEVRELGGQIGNEFVTIADFSHLSTHCKFIALLPQWDFLDFLAEHADRYPAFHLKMEAEVIDLLEEDRRIVGLKAKTRDGPLNIRADLIVGADGRHSIVREKAGLHVDELGAPMDVLWFRVSRR